MKTRKLYQKWRTLVKFWKTPFHDALLRQRKRLNSKLYPRLLEIFEFWKIYERLFLEETYWGSSRYFCRFLGSKTVFWTENSKIRKYPIISESASFTLRRRIETQFKIRHYLTDSTLPFCYIEPIWSFLGVHDFILEKIKCWSSYKFNII